MNEINIKNNIFKNLQNLILNNLRNILITIGILFICFISFQSYNYFSIQKLKKTSIKFFNSIEGSSMIVENLNEIRKTDNIFSTLSILKLIEINNEQKNYSISNELYKELILSNELDNLYISSIAAHASYALINASYLENTKNYLSDISIYISNISDEIESYASIKKELEYLFTLTELDLKNIDYKNNSKVLELYNEIINSATISSSVKERVKKIHEFQTYK